MIPGGAVNNTPRSCVPGFRRCLFYSFYSLGLAAFHPSFKRNTDSIERGCYCLICGSAGGGLRMRLAF
ncbi:hypothetical protein N7537_005779 [Penicillium hordei]|uniref:Uncharacterized protein n=1 Tax=Penicillium hordei TaxID=40994 RepID=A0AAD6E6R0_9EURO|nr:uncharacterized protein N7537_005779 [Penicillium hordei]KAJ5602823.1 hypothetical protein N7537_005779 [Penicillium hordei]